MKKVIYICLLLSLTIGVSASPIVSDSVDLFQELGLELQEKGNHSDALLKYQRALSLSREISDPVRIAKSYDLLGSCYAAQSEKASAYTNYTEALKHAVQSRDTALWVDVLIHAGHDCAKLGNIEKAERYLRKAERISKKHGFENRKERIFAGLATIALNKGNLEDAEDYIVYNFEQCEQRGDSQGIITSYYYLGQLLEKKNDLPQAIHHFKAGFELSTRMNNDRQRLNGLDLLDKVHARSGNFKEAHYYQDSARVLRAELRSQEKEQALGFLQERYHSEKKEKLIVDLEKEKELSQLNEELMQVKTRELLAWVVGLAVAIILIMGGLHYSYFRFKSRLDQQDHEREVARLREAEKKLRHQVRMMENGKHDRQEMVFLKEVRQFLGIYKFSKVELNIMELLNQGRSPRQIATLLSISESALPEHLQLISTKAGIDSADLIPQFGSEHGKKIRFLIQEFEERNS